LIVDSFLDYSLDYSLFFTVRAIIQFFQMILPVFLLSLLACSAFADLNVNLHPRSPSRIRAEYYAKRDAPANETVVPVKITPGLSTPIVEVKVLPKGNATWQTFNLKWHTAQQIS